MLRKSKQKGLSLCIRKSAATHAAVIVGRKGVVARNCSQFSPSWQTVGRQVEEL